MSLISSNDILIIRGDWASLSAWLPLLYDTTVILLTLWKCVPRVKNKGMNNFAMTGHIIRTLIKDGLMYYSVIFCINFVLAVMIMTAKVGLLFSYLVHVGSNLT